MRLYLDNSRTISFHASVLKQWEDDGRTLLTLSETAFYPTAGGQPHDTGTIDGGSIVDVFELDGEVVHVLDEPIEGAGDVAGEVDWPRRHDHMQQHTGQHILSQALIRICDIPTVGFAIGPDWSTIVLEKKPAPESLEAALDLANAIIDENRTVDVLFPTREEIEALPIRGTLPENEQIRVIRIDGFDWSPCGGTHSSSTGDVRLIVPLGIGKEKDTYRLEFVCGQRAERTSLRYARTVSDVASLLDVGPPEVVERTRNSLEKMRLQEQTIAELRDARSEYDCERLLAIPGNSGTGIISTILEGRTVHEVRKLAHMLVERPGIVALLVGTDGDKTGIAFARSEDRTEDMNQIMRSVCRETGCRGGGNAAFATGGGSGDVDSDGVLEVARQVLTGE